jgi:hypothetical protein
MKKIFCDCCGSEFKYDDQLAAVNGKPNSARAGGTQQSGWDVVADLAISFTKVRVAGTTSGSDHVDLCGECRWKMIDKLDPRPKGQTAGAGVGWVNGMTEEQVMSIFERYGIKKQLGTAISIEKAFVMDIYGALYAGITGRLPK